MSASAPAAAPAPAPAPARASRWKWAAIGALALLAAGTGAAAWAWTRPKPAPVVTRYSVLLRPNESLRPSGVAGNIAISPDGNRIVYVGSADGGTRLWLREHDKLRPTPIAGDRERGEPLLFAGREPGRLHPQRAHAPGGPAQRRPTGDLTDSLNASGGDWGADGYIYTELQVGLGRIRATGGPIEVLFRLSDEKHEIGAEYPNVMPDGKGLVFRRRLAGQPAERLRDHGDGGAERARRAR